MRKISLFLLLTLFISSFCLGQNNSIQTEIKAENVFELSIIKIYPDSFPQVSVIFQAKNKFGKPLWTLDQSEIKVTENDKNCDVLRLMNISENKPLNIGLVLDHSGSMFHNPAHLELYSKQIEKHYIYGTPFPKEYKTALDFAKKGLMSFLDETIKTSANDSILFIGFSGEVDKIYPLTNDVTNIKSFVKNVEPDGGTAFYDALFVSLENLASSADKSVIIALTDGLDENSKRSQQEIIDLAKEKKISIYTIGLGGADEKILGKIATETNGFYYYTNDPEKLKEIYLNIKEQIKSIYQVDYTSTNVDKLNQMREIQFSFVNDTLEFLNDSSIYSLSKETITYIEKKEEERKTDERNKLILGGVVLLALSIGGFLIYKKKKDNNGLSIIKVYPNPFIDEITVEYSVSIESVNPTLRVIDGNGNIFSETQLTTQTGSKKINFGSIYRGIYFVQLSDSSALKTVKIIKK